ncbi:MAG: 3-deoxy-manno-octulosonate cytidylyltransferase [Planctomycetes bacterium]|nr:3-deoxy-manno-octulosonate cytidylyltransferase [Planctomycetota bacterium]
MTTVAIIPARLGSTRLPGKPLLRRTGKYLIQHTVEQACQARRLDRVLVATDDQQIADACASFGAECLMTRADHRTGTDRLAEAACLLGLADDDVIVNVQGDEPEIPPACIDDLVDLLARTGTPMATLATPIGPEQARDPNRVKVVFDLRGLALYFSRSVIPFDRDRTEPVEYYQHLGIYAYRAAFLQTYAALDQTPAERAEKLEQLRALQHGHAIAVGTVLYDGAGIDTPADYDAFVRRRVSS